MSEDRKPTERLKIDETKLSSNTETSSRDLGAETSSSGLRASEGSRTKKRIIVPPKKYNQVEFADVTVVPSIGQLLDNAKAIIGSQLQKYKSKVERGVTLDQKEERIITNYLEALNRAAKEEREQARADDLSNLTDEELLQLATQLATTKRIGGSE